MTSQHCIINEQVLQVPSPASHSVNASHVQEAERQYGGNDLSAIQSSPEEGESNRQFLACVEIRQPDSNCVSTSSC